MTNEEDKTDDESIEGLELEVNNNISSDDNNESTQNNIDVNEEENSVNEEIIDDSSINVQKKQKNIKKILFIAGGVLLSIILLMTVLYFVGIFDEEPANVNPETSQIDKTKNEISMVPQKPKYKFKIKDIDKKRLNRKLSLLTKNEIIIEKKIISEKPKERIEQAQAIEKKIQESKIKSGITPENKEIIEINKNESIKEDKTDLITTKEEISKVEVEKEVEVKVEKNEVPIKIEDKEVLKEEEIINNEEEIIKEENIKEEIVLEKIPENNSDKMTMKSDENRPNILKDKEILKEEKESSEKQQLKEENITEQKSFLKFAQIATIKKNLYLSFLHQLKELDNRISVCRNDINYIQIFIGPFKSEEDRKETLIKVNNNIVKDAFAIDFTEEEFNKRCNF